MTIKYSSSGATLWTRAYNGPFNQHDFVRAMALDSNGNVIVTGSSLFTISYEYTTIKYSGEGVALWTNRSSAGYEPLAIAVDSGENVFVTGYSGSDGYYDYATVAYSSGGTPLWARSYNGPGNGNDVAYAVAVDGSGNVIVTGSSYGSGSSLDYATIKYSGAGEALWTNRYNGPANGDDEALSLAIVPGGAIYVTGASDGDYGPTATTFDFLTLKYVPVSPITLRVTMLTNGEFNIAFTNTPGATFSVLATTNLVLPLTNWTVVGSATETAPGQFEFTDPQATNCTQRFYSVSSP